MRAAVICALVAIATAQSNPFSGSGCNCSSFCAGSCSINGTKPKNMTLYRMTPLHTDSPADKNTGDGPGDTSYVISRRTAAYDCKVNPMGFHCDSLVVKGDDPNSTDIVIAFDMEVDGQWGPYLYCNPTDAKHPERPWNCTTTLSPSSGGHAPAQYPAQCKAANYSGYDKVCFAASSHGERPPTVHTGVSLGDCCSETIKANGWDYTYYAANQTCLVFDPRAYDHHSFACDGGVSGHWEDPSHHESVCECPRVHKTVGRENLTVAFGSHGRSFHPAGGEWYSHPAGGQCRPGHTVADGSCSWRALGIRKAVNATCVYDRLDKNVERRNATCFDACPKRPDTGDFNRTTDCYSECYSHTSSHMEGDDLSAPWGLAFASEAAASGGCPTVQVPDGFKFL